MDVLYFLQRTLGQKVIVGLTGLGLCAFIFIHMLGNLLILSGPERYNLYAQFIHDSIVLETLEKGLFLFFILHIVLAIVVNITNKKAKKDSYKIQAQGSKKTFVGDRFLALQGIVLFVFLAHHLLTFKFGAYYEMQIQGQTVRDVHRLAVETFKKPLYALEYFIVLVILSLHLFHGLPASLRTLGFYPVQFQPWIVRASFLFAVTSAVGFLLPIIYILLF